MRRSTLTLTVVVVAACSSSGDGPRYAAKRGHYSILALGDSWSESRDLGATVFSDGHGGTIAIRAVAKQKGWPEPREADLVFPATERVLRSLPGAEVSGPQPVGIEGFQAVAYDVTFTPSRGGGERYQRRHVTLIGRRGVWHLLHTAKEGALAETSAAFERTLESFREEG
jgi:hypothetical protein